jgi:hypothetical protein
LQVLAVALEFDAARFGEAREGDFLLEASDHGVGDAGHGADCLRKVVK